MRRRQDIRPTRYTVALVGDGFTESIYFSDFRDAERPQGLHILPDFPGRIGSFGGVLERAIQLTIIQVVIGYRVQMHNLSRLLRLSLLFTDELKEVFELNTTEGAQLYQLLQDAYSQSRYNSAFDPDGESVRILSKQVKKSIKLQKEFTSDM